MLGMMNDFLSSKPLPRDGFQAFLTSPGPPQQKTSWMKDKTTRSDDACFYQWKISRPCLPALVYYGAPIRQTSLIFAAATDGTSPTALARKGRTGPPTPTAERITELGGVVKSESCVTKIIIEDGMATVETALGNTYSAATSSVNTDPYQMVFKLNGARNCPRIMCQAQRSETGNSLRRLHGPHIDLKAKGYDLTRLPTAHQRLEVL